MINKFKIILFILFLSLTSYSQISNSRIEELQQSIDSILSPVIASGVTVSAKVMHADYYKTLYEYNPDAKMIPASITKLITCACAYSKFGKGYTFLTICYTDDNNLSDGVINGNLYLKGFGDPDLNSTDIEYLAEQISKSSIKEITGNIVADETYFDANYGTLSGYYGGDTGPSYWPYVTALSLNKNEGSSNPSISAGNLLSSKLISKGVTVSGTVISGTTPKGAKQVTQLSHSIYDVLAHTLKESDNQSAITVFKLLGAKLVSEPGSIENGQKAIESFLTEIGIERYAYEILEGSGLTRNNRVSADVYMKILKYMYEDRQIFDYFMTSLSIGGKDGTLKNRMIGTEAEGNVYAKTGTLNSVSALSGYAIDKDNEILLFYIVMNGFGGNATGMRNIQDNVCVKLTGFSRK